MLLSTCQVIAARCALPERARSRLYQYAFDSRTIGVAGSASDCSQTLHQLPNRTGPSHVRENSERGEVPLVGNPSALPRVVYRTLRHDPLQDQARPEVPVEGSHHNRQKGLRPAFAMIRCRQDPALALMAPPNG